MYVYSIIFALLLTFCGCQDRSLARLFNYFKQVKYIQSFKINDFFMQAKPMYFPNDRIIWLLSYKKIDLKEYCLYLKQNRNKKVVSFLIREKKSNSCQLNQETSLKWSNFNHLEFLNISLEKYFFRIILESKQKPVEIRLSADLQLDNQKNWLKLNQKFSQILKKPQWIKDGDYCEKYNNDCKLIRKNVCFLCERGWGGKLEGECTQKLNKVCGETKCGRLGEPPCFQGFKISEKETSMCRKNPKGAYCAKGLNVQCEGAKLICANY